MLACLDLQDHLVDLYVADYLQAHPNDLPDPVQQKAFRAAWADELAKGGTFDRFEMSCVTSLTKGGFGCALKAESPSGVIACLKQNAEHGSGVTTENPQQTGSR